MSNKEEGVEYDYNYFKNRIKFLEEQIKSKENLIHQLLLKVKELEDGKRND